MPIPRSKAAKGNRKRHMRTKLEQKAADRRTAAWDGLRALAEEFDAAPVLEMLEAGPDGANDFQKRVLEGFIQQHMNALVERQLKKEEMDQLCNIIKPRFLDANPAADQVAEDEK
jgi:hypothetical protein